MPSRWLTTSGGGRPLTLVLMLALAAGAACRRGGQAAALDASVANVRDSAAAPAIAPDPRSAALGDRGAGRQPSSQPTSATSTSDRVLGGRVVDGQGRPVSGAQVRAVSADGAFWLGGGELGVVPGPVPPIPKADVAPSNGRVRGVGWSRRTDAAGRFVLFGLPAADVRLVVDHPLLRPAQSGLIRLGPAAADHAPKPAVSDRWLDPCPTVSAGGLQGRRRRRGVDQARCAAPSVAPGAAIVGDMKLDSGGVVRGRVVDEHGKALAHAFITARDAGLTRLAHSDDAGTFSAAGLIGRTEVTAVLDGYASVAGAAQATAGQSTDITLTLRARIEAISGHEGPTAQVAGLVREWRTGAPIQRFFIRVEGGQKRIGVTNKQGYFRIKIARSCRSLSFGAPGFAGESVAVNVPESLVGRDAPDLRVELRLSGTVRGQAFDSDGQPIAGARISCAGLAASTDAQGRFEIAGVPVGVHKVHLALDDGQTIRSDMVSVHADGRPAVVRFDVAR